MSASRYTTYTMLALVDVPGGDQPQFPVVRSKPRARRTSSADPSVRATTLSVSGRHSQSGSPPSRSLSRLVVIQAFFGYYNGLSEGRKDHTVQVQAAKVFRNYQTENEELVFDIPTQFLPETFQLIRVAQRDKLSSFASP